MAARSLRMTSGKKKHTGTQPKIPQISALITGALKGGEWSRAAAQSGLQKGEGVFMSCFQND